MQVIVKVIKGIGALLVLLLLVVVCFRLAAAFREDSVPDEIAPPSGVFVEISDARLFVQEQGPSDGQAVLLVHGTGAWSGLWGETTSELAQNGYRTIAVDLPPFGFSELRESDDFSRSSQARRFSERV